MLKIVLMVGIPASGKSSYCKELMEKEPNKWKRINNDSIRESIDFGVWSSKNEKVVKAIREKMLIEFLRKDYNVLIDNVNATNQHFDEVWKTAKTINKDIELSTKHFYIDVDEAINRDSLRLGSAKVGEKVVRKWFKALGGTGFKTQPTKIKVKYQGTEKPFILEQDPNLEKAIIVDLDGTLAIIGNRSPFDAANCHLDSPNMPIVETVKLFYQAGYKILFCSGRQEKDRMPSTKFIEKSLPNMDYQLFMRKTADMRPDNIVKEEIFNDKIRKKYNILFILDDRDKVVLQWRRLGLTCFQVAPGDF